MSTKSPKIGKEWKQNAKTMMEKQVKETFELRVSAIEIEIQSIISNYKIPSNLTKNTWNSIKNAIINWKGVDLTSSVIRKEKKKRKTKKKEKNESWYNGAAKNWFNQRVSRPDFFGNFWANICLSIKEYCKNDINLLYKCLHRLLNANVGFGKSTKAQPLLQASIINKTKKLQKFLKNNKIADVDRIKLIYFERHHKNMPANNVRLEVIYLLNKLILNPNINTFDINQFSNDNFNNIGNDSDSVKLIHSMPFENVSRNKRYNPIDVQYNINRHPIMDDMSFNNNTFGFNDTINQLNEENERLKSELIEYKLEAYKYKMKYENLLQKYKPSKTYQTRNQQIPSPFPPSITNIKNNCNNQPILFQTFNKNIDDIFTTLPKTVEDIDDNITLKYTQIPQMPIISTNIGSKDTQSVSTNSTKDDLEVKNDDDMYLNNGLPDYTSNDYEFEYY